MQDASDQSDGGVYALQQSQLLYEKAVLDVPNTIRDARKHITQGLVAIPKNSVWSTGLTADSDAFKLGKKSC